MSGPMTWIQVASYLAREPLEGRALDWPKAVRDAHAAARLAVQALADALRDNKDAIGPTSVTR